MIDLLREIGQTLRNNRLRTMLTGLSVAWGIFMLMVLLGASRGVANSFRDRNGSQNTDRITLWGGRTSLPYKGFKEGRRIQLKGDDINRVAHDNSAHITAASASASVDTAIIYTERDYISGGFEAVYPDYIDARYDMVEGRFINDRDIEEGRRVMVLSGKDARTLFADESAALGSTVSSMGLAWTVVVVYDHRWETSPFIPYTTFKAVTGNNDDAYQIDVRIKDVHSEEDGEALEKDVIATLAAAHNFNADDPSAVWVWNRFTSYLQGAKAMGYLDLAVWLIGLFTLLSGIVGVSNIMFVSVRERTHEIGIRRAIGAKPRSILAQILAESVAVTSIFGYIGIVAGTFTLQIVSSVLGDVDGFKNPTIDLSIAAKVTVALIICGALAGLFPALKAIKVKPVEALRDE